MKKLLRKRDILFLTLAGIGDTIEEVKDPLNLVSSAYENMYGFVPAEYRRHNFSSLVGRSFKTGYIERVIKNGEAYLRLTSAGKEHIQREFPVMSFSKTWNKKWIIVVFDIQETSRKQRNNLRNMLKNIGFGMLQQSAWITPLPIGEDVKESISHNGFYDNAFVLEVSHVLLGDPKILARRVWNLDKLEEVYLDLQNKKKKATESIVNTDGRHNKRYYKYKMEEKSGENLEEKLREQKKKLLEFIVTLPPLPRELFPAALQKAISI